MEIQRYFLLGSSHALQNSFSKNFALRITDLDDEQLGKRINGVLVEGEGSTDKNMEWADLLWVTGTTVVNDTIEQFINANKPKIFYGTTVSGAAYLLGLKRFCAMSK